MNRIFYWAVMVIGCVAAIYPLFINNEKNLFVALYLVYVFFAFMSAIFMLIALCKIRSFLKERGLGDRMSPLRMLVHALAFLLYVFVYSLLTIATKFAGGDSKDLYFLQWFFFIIVGFFSFFCLFFVLWHLGSKDAVKERYASESTMTQYITLQADDIMQFVPRKRASIIEVEEKITELMCSFKQNLDTRIWTQFLLKSAYYDADSRMSISERKTKSQSVIISGKLDKNAFLDAKESVLL